MVVLAILFCVFSFPVVFFYYALADNKNRNGFLWAGISVLLFIFTFVAFAWGILLFFPFSSIVCSLLSLFFTYLCSMVLYFFLKKNWAVLEKETNEDILDDLD